MNSPVQIYVKDKLAHLLHQKTILFSYQNLLQIHSQLITTGFQIDPSWLSPFLQLCASNSSSIDYATVIFHHTEQPDLSTWQVMIRRHADTNPSQSLSFFRDMQSMRDNNYTDPFIFASVIKACGKLNAIREGKSVHCQVLRFGLDCNTNVLNTLIHFYSNSANSIFSSCNLFDKIPHRTIVTVNCMISGFLKNKLFEAGLCLFNRVLSDSFDFGLKPNDVTLVILISGCTEIGNLGIGRTLHSYCSKTLLGLKSEVSNALMNFYAKFRCINEAVLLFEELPERDVISWNTIIASYAENYDAKKALQLFNQMRFNGLEGDAVTLINLVSACAQSKDHEMGKSIHANLKKRGIGTVGPLGTSLINMYSKCGLIEFARKVFDELQEKNIISWNSIITGYVECGCFYEALNLFNLMQLEKLRPDEITMLGLISACSNLGELNHGRRIHSYIVSNGLDGNIVLSNALIDMYAKCGSMSRALMVFNKMPKRDVISWTSVIVGHAINGEGKEALVSFQQMCDERIEPNFVTFIGVLLACDHAGLVDDGRKLYDIMCNVCRIKPKIEHCGCMVDMLARAGMLEEAHEFVKRMPFEPNAIVWRMLIGACRVHEDVDLGLSLVGGLIELNQFQGPEDYVISSNIYAKAGKWDDVLQARRLMLAQQVLKEPGQSLVYGATE
ncbi:Pentatricopeptide repeat [Macleaya cordata]|uniref:Pentatricopeptide repeat n=1 Tax=Macleaya cordata TaxID=56857 RepID=A0A200QSA0_MACCD|nr:Pentatricopeptide repeat [Macleaya cordata]